MKRNKGFEELKYSKGKNKKISVTVPEKQTIQKVNMNNNKKATQDRPLTVLIDDSLSCVGRYFSVSEIIVVAQI